MGPTKRLAVVTNPGSVIRSRDTSRPVILVGFQNQGNLGIGYLASTLRSKGYTVHIFDFEADPDELCDLARELKPILIGFSLIFQFYIEHYAKLLRRMRECEIRAHFTMGGHFPSLSYRETLELLPELDSVVRFEGELTLVELVDCLGTGGNWQGIQGIACRCNGEVVTTAPRHLLDDLDELPYPDRSFTPMATLGHPIIPILASRGCARTCSFCSIQTFYRAASGRIVRTRKPSKVVEEMKTLHEERGATIFLFQDDDFPLFGPVWRRWAFEFAGAMQRSGLVGRVIWKMNCRADAVEAGVLSALRDAGLYLVYMGLESGNEEGLKTLHKQITVEQNLEAVEILKRLDLRFEYGFMLFDPSSTFESVRANIAFLRDIVGDGFTAALFCRMLPYDGTSIKEDLARTGRLRGDVRSPYYDFLDPRLDEFYRMLTRFLDIRGWVHGQDALSAQVTWAWQEVAVMERLFPPLDGMSEYKGELRRVTRAGNQILLNVVEDLSYVASEGRHASWESGAVEQMRRAVLQDLLAHRDGFIASHQARMLRALGPRVRTSSPAHVAV
jgi:anaerobic magnesium-protoporphyrin IX monomethyl ester cyclase